MRLSEVIPWLRMPPDDAHSLAVDYLIDIQLFDADGGGTIAQIPWVIDGIDADEVAYLMALRDVLVGSPELMSGIQQRTSSLRALPGTVDRLVGMRGAELVRFLTTIATEDPWLARIVLYHASNSPAGASISETIDNFKWFLEDLVEDLVPLEDLPWALRAAERIAANTGDIGQYLIDAARVFARTPDVSRQLSRLPWVIDGIDDDEAAFLSSLPFVLERNRKLFDELLDTRFSQSTVVSLPLAGDVKIWLIQRSPFSSGDESLSVAARSVRIIEELMGAPFPTTAVVVLVVTDETIDVQGIHLGSHVLIGESWRTAIPHEIAHYYPLQSPTWFSEGIAEFARAQVNHRSGVQSLDDRMEELSREAQRQCFDGFGFEWQSIENLRHLTYLLQTSPFGVLECVYPMGENFLLAVFDTIGEEAFLSALRELISFEDRITEEQIYQGFLEHTSTELRARYQAMYRRLHGGAYVDPLFDRADDHGDVTGFASEIAINELVDGELDYRFDFDYFKFPVDEGQKYRIIVTHPALRSSSGGLFDSSGVDLTIRSDVIQAISRTSSGFQFLWIPPSSGDYYFAVRNFGGYTGDYTLKVTPHVPSTDDHGDTLASATRIDIGGAAEGVLNDDFDLDYFWFQPEAGQRYKISIDNKIRVGGMVRTYIEVRLYSADGSRSWPGVTAGEVDGESYFVTLSTSQPFYIRLQGVNDVDGPTYTLRVQRDSPS